ncbi:macrophage mannose receptor 1-like [Clarias gariepinus]|uniref:macrophage mannose receptor 1-like n=1 Tax=Clarias gariepinus TaxID=13013 RepID=UPI00234D68A1|nr:macrophage mannose receptor 1-like [Clarias gariepinus]
MNQTDARAACRENYIDLVTVYSDKDNTELDYAMSTTPMGRINYGLIGLYRGQFSEKWSNGDPVTFSNLAGDCGTSSCCAAMKPDGSWESLQCNMTKYFMCYEQDASSQTPNYHLILESKTWYEAQRYCRGRYTDLVSIRDQQQNEEVKIKGLNSSTSFWTGLLRDDWQWTDGGNSAYRNWASGHPQSSPYDCVVMWQRTLNWYSVPCSDSHYPLCYSTFSRPVNSILTTFQYIQGYKIQTDARTACRGNYIDLVTLYSDEDNTKLYNLTIGAGGGGRWPGWIGLYRGQFSEKWSNGDPVTFSNLAGDCGTSSCCAAMKPDGSWESLQCTGTRYFMCYEEDASSQTPNYHLILENKTWYGAQRYCRGRYTDLVSIRDQQQNELVKIKGLNSSTSFWIGLLRDDWQWTDGGNSAYRNWDWWRGEPRPSPYDCVEMHLGKWYSAPCSNYYYLSLCSSSK